MLLAYLIPENLFQQISLVSRCYLKNIKKNNNEKPKPVTSLTKIAEMLKADAAYLFFQLRQINIQTK